MRACGGAGVQACFMLASYHAPRVCTASSPVRERGREIEIEIKREREIEIKRERESER